MKVDYILTENYAFLNRTALETSNYNLELDGALGKNFITWVG